MSTTTTTRTVSLAQLAADPSLLPIRTDIRCPHRVPHRGLDAHGDRNPLPLLDTATVFFDF